jgi:cytosol aminopeptidase family protein
LSAALVLGFILSARADDVPKEQSYQAPHEMKMNVKMIGLMAQPTDLQIVCVFKHKPGGDTLVDAMADFNARLGGLLSAVRDRGEFAGELGETFLFLPPAGAITPKQVLLIGLGDEKDLSLDTLRVVGRVAVREAVRLKAAHVSFAPTIRDQGNQTIDVGTGDQVVAENVISAYDTEKRLQSQGLAAPFSIDDWTIEAGPAFFASAAEKVSQGTTAASSALTARSTQPYVLATK